MSTLKSILLQPLLLTPELTKEISGEIMNGNANNSQIGAFLMVLKLLGKETQPEYIAAVAEAMRNASLPIKSTYQVIDIVGTGGDGKNTFNVSTASSIVVAGAGCKVAKVLIFSNVARKQSFLFFLWFS